MFSRLTKQVVLVLILTLVVFLVHLWAQKQRRATPETVLPPTHTATTSPTLTPSPATFTAIPSLIPATNTQQPTTPSVPQFYTVQTGQTLGQIAAMFGLNIEDLALANHITDINLIYAGQELYLGSVPIIVPEPSVFVGKQIIVILSTQRAYAFEDGVLAHIEFIVATGVTAYPTVTGNYEIYIKLESTRMTGPGYDIANVPWTMYFYQGYGFHGAPWNHNLGTPGSHGCVNMSVEDADWLFHWASVGTPVTIFP
ncbi:hypothetical protein A3K29_05770 [Candidatus Collierbacteria bacterium RIFOXYB2_FULL_46_14]|uniref:Uncharacterized protein n=1 Tax=Candidatus Collierbacteria bacterium GW2011_GWA2_46_26 TaxID=1618381 RepID=A0A0G1RRJ7_9BACT|nr:MAG: hypothetical protein UX47_C0009G0005 [Candidatus Collierbacteria bacterium GW2011_GWA2_46_26]OGD73597.1 MAG: hypothetical protein A3K29_05770 [Candidatus Collierbacteria bacterium RIFOXYB2_FULL_46_14]OGD76639.1 MAG: hypothetical protein A3K43_05770 [Candidatus Collierbacteria bacterium RIFOXYA2_FULL_46_20]OGD77975.1 MAG: hypothetical protein A3K39_05770 [Candidatus Collierbacteria bacterium RIFOXYC2_FULL_43_15]OGD79999.1 MAG: hypothetical protein A2320_00200 [Pseudomonadales bacterium G